MGLPQMPAAGIARVPIKKMLLGDGGSAQVTVNGQRRIVDTLCFRSSSDEATVAAIKAPSTRCVVHGMG